VEMSLLEYLRAARIAGDVATSRESNVDHARAFAAGDAAHLFGLPPRRTWTYEQVIGLLAERVGIDPDPARTRGTDTIDPTLTAAALRRMRDLLAKVLTNRGQVLLASAHPAGVLEVHLVLARLLRDAGCTVLTPVVDAADASDGLSVRYLGGVAVYTDGINLRHSHSPHGMVTMVDALARDGTRPDLVIADHGFAGGAAAAGLEVACFADSNDPALFVGEAEGRIAVTVPLDDNVEPHLYADLVEHLLDDLTT
jgi:Phosphatase